MSSKSMYRSGLAMLELVLVLPLLLFIMALIVGYGAASAWKVRENGIARLAVWETRWPRTGETNPVPQYWQVPSATMEPSDLGNNAELDNQQVDQPIARGPLPPATVNSELLDPTRGMRQGSAGLTHSFPLAKTLGSFQISASTAMVDDKWQYQRMGMYANSERRLPIIYTLPEAPASLEVAYVQSVLAISQASFSNQLRPLDSDPDFIYYNTLFGWGGGAPDFQPRFHPMCTTNRKVVDPAVQQLINRIQGGPKTPSVAQVMGMDFLALYERALGAFQGILKSTPPPSPQMAGLAQSQIPLLQADIQELQSFLKSFQQQRGR
jgi:hypothetical protein